VHAVCAFGRCSKVVDAVRAFGRCPKTSLGNKKKGKRRRSNNNNNDLLNANSDKHEKSDKKSQIL
jgi:hypothetical protein